MVGSRQHTFELNFGLANAAFDGAQRAPEIAAILRSVADRVEAGSTDGLIADVNGNTVGGWDFESGEPEDDD